MSDYRREDEARWIAKMRLRHSLGDEYVCGLADVLRALDERDELRACVESFLRAFDAEPWDEASQDRAEAALRRAVRT